jgi:hypothetical protein
MPSDKVGNKTGLPEFPSPSLEYWLTLVVCAVMILTWVYQFPPPGANKEFIIRYVSMRQVWYQLSSESDKNII